MHIVYDGTRRIKRIKRRVILTRVLLTYPDDLLLDIVFQVILIESRRHRIIRTRSNVTTRNILTVRSRPNRMQKYYRISRPLQRSSTQQYE